VGRALDEGELSVAAPPDVERLIERTYAAFNARDIDAVLRTMHPRVEWPNGMEGGTVSGHQGIRDYWTRQWGLIDPSVRPTRVTHTDDGRVAVDVHQVVRDLAGHVLKEEDVRHIYSFEDGLITSMEIQKATVADR
jgi:ketosteroid isomerase-like protein